MVQGLFSCSMTPSRTKASPFLSLLGFYPQDICCIVAAQLIHSTHCFHIQDREKMEGDGGGLVAKSCPTLATPWTVACQAPPFTGMLQARILEGFAISFSRGFSRPRDQTRVSCSAGSLFTNWARGKPEDERGSTLVRKSKPFLKPSACVHSTQLCTQLP